MANLSINLASPLIGSYRVSFRDSEGNLLTNPLITQNQTVVLNNEDVAVVTIGNGVYTLNNVFIKLESLADNTCQDEFNTDLIVNCPTSTCTVNINSISEQCISAFITLVVNASTTGEGNLQYAVTTGVIPPSIWQASNTFTNLSQNTSYVVHVRNIIDPSGCTAFQSYNTGNCLRFCGCSGLSSFAIESINRIGATTDYAVGFNGCFLGNASWKVKNSLGDIVVSGTVIPPGDTLTLAFGNLAAGIYTFELQGIDCQGLATSTFTVTGGIVCPECQFEQNGNCVPIPNCGGGGGGDSLGELRYFLWEPDGNEDNFFKPKFTSVGNNQYTITDEGDNQGLTVYYMINGVSNPINAKTLSTLPIPAFEEIWITKYGHSTAVSNINDATGISWRLYYDSSNPLPAKIGNFLIYIY